MISLWINFFSYKSTELNVIDKIASETGLSADKLNNFKTHLDTLAKEVSGINGVRYIDKLKDFRSGVGVFTSLIGSVIAINILTPIVRNKLAAISQKTSLSRITSICQSPAENKAPKVSHFVGMNDFLAKTRNYNSSLKI